MAAISSNFPLITTEIIILVAIFIVCLAVAFTLGKGKSIALILSFYPAIFFYSQFPLPEKLLIFSETPWQIFFGQLVLFLIFFAITFFVINIIAGRGVFYTDRRQKLKLTILAIGIFTLILLIVHQLIPLPEVAKYFPKTGEFFASEKLFFWILLTPLALILIFARK